MPFFEWLELYPLKFRRRGLVAAEELIELLVELGPERIEARVERAGVCRSAFSLVGFRGPASWLPTALG